MAQCKGRGCQIFKRTSTEESVNGISHDASRPSFGAGIRVETRTRFTGGDGISTALANIDFNDALSSAASVPVNKE